MKANRCWIASLLSLSLLPCCVPALVVRAADNEPQASTSSTAGASLPLGGAMVAQAQATLSQQLSGAQETTPDLRALFAAKNIVDFERGLQLVVSSLGQVSPGQGGLSEREKNYLSHYVSNQLPHLRSSRREAMNLAPLWQGLFEIFMGEDARGKPVPGLEPATQRRAREIFEPLASKQGPFVPRYSYQKAWTDAWLREAEHNLPPYPALSSKVLRRLQSVPEASPEWANAVRFLLPRYALPAYDPKLAKPQADLTASAKKIESLSLLPYWEQQAGKAYQDFLRNHSIPIVYMLHKDTQQISGPAAEHVAQDQEELVQKILHLNPAVSGTSPAERQVSYFATKREELQQKLSSMAAAAPADGVQAAAYSKLLLEAKLVEDLQRGSSLLQGSLKHLLNSYGQLTPEEIERFQQASTAQLEASLAPLEHQSLREAVTTLQEVSQGFWKQAFVLLSDPHRGIMRPEVCGQIKKYFENNAGQPFTPQQHLRAQVDQSLQKAYGALAAPHPLLGNRTTQLHLQAKENRLRLITAAKQSYKAKDQATAVACVRLLLSTPVEAPSAAQSLQHHLDRQGLIPGQATSLSATFQASIVSQLPHLLQVLEQHEGTGPALEEMLQNSPSLRKAIGAGPLPSSAETLARAEGNAEPEGRGTKRNASEMSDSDGTHPTTSGATNSGATTSGQRQSPTNTSNSPAHTEAQQRPAVIAFSGKAGK